MSFAYCLVCQLTNVLSVLCTHTIVSCLCNYCICNYDIVAKTCQKPYAKTPQKTHAKIWAKNLPKTFHKKINKNILNYFKNFLILPKLLNLNTNNMNYPLQLKKKLAQTMAQVDHQCMGLDLLEAYEYHLASDSFELLQYWMEYFGVFDNPEENLLDQMLNPKTLQTK